MHINPFHNKFETAFVADKIKHIKSYAVSWDYQNKRRKRGIKYSEDLPDDFFVFKDVNQIHQWMKWFKGEYPSFYDKSIIDPLVEKSLSTDEKVFKKLNLALDRDNYLNIGLNNAHDFFIPQSYPVPSEFKINNVLDFGAGYGRQANLWWPYLKGRGNFIGIDAIELPYGLQYHYYKALEEEASIMDYIDSPTSFKIEPSASKIYHLPTWRLDLIPDNSMDLVMAVQVLPELNSRLIKYVLRHFQRILKPGGAFYIRDLNYMYKTIGAIDIDKILINNGFSLEYRAFIEHNKHLHGIPKIWRKNITAILASQKNNILQKQKYLLEDLDALTGGFLNRLKKQIR